MQLTGKKLTIYSSFFVTFATCQQKINKKKQSICRGFKHLNTLCKLMSWNISKYLGIGKKKHEERQPRLTYLCLGTEQKIVAFQDSFILVVTLFILQQDSTIETFHLLLI